jgi:small subunit ribosomal protein S9
VGRRKTAVAQVRIYPQDKAAESDLIINGKKMKEYFAILPLQNVFIAPLKTAGQMNKFRVSVLARGGGQRGQAEATRLGIARALVKYDPDLRKSLKDAGFLFRDPRIVERKKPGLKKARRAPQWQKR